MSEAQEILVSLNNVLVDFEKDPTNIALLHELFRYSHTLKSMAQSMGYESITKLTHSMEAALALLRDGRLKAGKNTVNLLFKSVDTLSDLIDEAKNEKAKKVKIAPLVKKFEEIASASLKEKRKAGEEKRLKSMPDDIDPLNRSHSEVQSVRIPLVQLDSLMELAGELVINRTRLAQIAQTIENNALEETVAHMSILISALQDQIVQVRLVPLEYIFTPYPRIVRDMAVDQKKEVDFLIEGSDIGLDRSIQDEINEPLLHLIKNAITHGVEEPEEREKLKKPRRGRIKLAARRERNFVILELSDDGRGIGLDEIKEVALRTGLITKEEFSVLTPKEVIKLITYLGYSRIKKVTEAAGRGVGLNVSRVKVESFGGTLDIDTEPNKGTTLSIKLPLTMAIVQVMLVGIADETYCIPLSYITDMINVSAREVKTMEQHEMISYRDKVLPLIRIREKLGFSSSRFQPLDSNRSAKVPTTPIVVVEAGPKKAGLAVDRFLGQQEVVIKPLTGILKNIKGVSGATILGTGKAALIVDIGSICERAVIL